MGLSNLKISLRLALLLALLSLLIATVGMLGLSGMQQTNQGLNSVYQDRVVPLQQLKQVADLYAVDVVDTAHKVRDGALTAAQGVRIIQRAREQIRQHWTDYLGTEMIAEENRLVQQFEQRRTVADAAVATLETLLQAGDLEAIRQFAAREMYPALDPLQGVLGSLVQLQLDTARTVYEHVEAVHARTRLWIGFAIGTCVLLSIGLGTLVTRSITHQLGAEPHDAVKLAQSVAQGDLSVSIDLRAADQDSLMAQLQQMQQSLSRLVSIMRQGSESVATASAQIAQGNHDLSARTEQQASAIEQTAASMEQLTAAVRHNAAHASAASQLANEASGVARHGGKMVGDVVRTMSEINESSRQIADIIGVIDGIAFQTNILALNAAVEAARAGELGRGFAVVAAEVRSLAGRSAEAAREIRQLIGASVARVEAGSALVNHAGTTMTELVSAIQRVSDLMHEISAASKEQSQGVDQVNSAISQMDQTTQQNAALVEEMAAATDSLKAQAGDLVGAVTAFKIAGTASAMPPALPTATPGPVLQPDAAAAVPA
ncbi:MAG: chemotaxis protein [Burkholderiales bacterium RIFOXYC12_FULL_65_23]|uniref:methyl-accepting chemotaxis protein n=1 Tax=Malikia spinosa TaxID=86180 RepID=UPI0008D1FD88|nr:MAG: chemotaxis protein [Burkholderiales bacterium RIFOXYC12_FULL_65_23]